MQQVTVVPSGPDALFGVHDIQQDGGRVGASMDVGPWGRGPDGDTCAGALGVLVDNVLGYALMASLAPGDWSISTEIWVDLLGPIPGSGSVVTADAVSVQVGSYSAGQVLDEPGNLVAVCRQRGRRVTPTRGKSPEPANLCSTLSDGLSELIGLRSDGGHHAMSMSDAVANPRGMLHGGVSLAASEVVATQSRRDEGSLLSTTSIHIVHTRGVPPGATVTFEAVTRHAGRSLWVTDVAGTVDGKLCTTARATAQ